MIDVERAFLPLRIAVLTVSDTRTLETDSSGALLVERALTAGHIVVERLIVADERARIAEQLQCWVDGAGVDVVLTTGGTGITARDVTPEAVRDVIQKEIPGFGELFRAMSVATIGTSTVQSRALGGVAKSTYVFALPGSTGACRDAWDGILVHQLDSRHRPCNFAELLPRLVE
jgi:molybdopterin adenylyltransferase